MRFSCAPTIWLPLMPACALLLNPLHLTRSTPMQARNTTRTQRSVLRTWAMLATMFVSQRLLLQRFLARAARRRLAGALATWRANVAEIR